MHKPGAMAVLALLLVMACGASYGCPMLPSSMAAGTTPMPGGCHGHRDPMPAPTQTCCHATPQVLAAVQVRPSVVLLNVVLGLVSSTNHGGSQQHIPVGAGSSDVSPPLSIVLRI